MFKLIFELDTIENKNLSKTEKMYVFFDHLDIQIKIYLTYLMFLLEQLKLTFTEP